MLADLRCKTYLYFLVCLAPIVAVPVATAESLFKFDGKVYQDEDLAPAEQAQLHDIRMDHYNHLSAVADQAALNLYFDTEAKRQGKSRSQIEGEALAVTEPTDKQVSDWYDANKGRIPPSYTLDKISGEIRVALKEQGKKEKREALIAKLKRDGKLSLLVAEPVAPVVKIDTAGSPTRGKGHIEIVEFADYQCPHCKVAAGIVDDLVKRYDGKVKFVFMDFPIKGEFSELAAQGAFCADKQGKYWEFHDLAYQKQETLHDKDAAVKLADSLKLDAKAFQECLTSAPAKARVAKGHSEAERLGLTGTPTIFVNGRRVRGYEADELDKEIKRALKAGQS